MTATEFEYDGIKSSVFGLYICRFDGIEQGAAPIGSEITVNTVKSPGGNTFIRTGSVYETPLTFTFQVVKYDNNGESQQIEARELAKIMQWLVRSDCNHYLRFEQSGWDNVFYNCSLKVQKYVIAGQICGLEIEATCDAPWGYSELKHYHFKLGSNEQNPFYLYNYSDENGGLFPDLVKIRVLNDCDLSIKNTFLIKNDKNNKKVITTTIKNCKNGEEIIFDKHRNIKSSNPHAEYGLANDFNFQFLQLFCDFYNAKNTITANKSCEISIDYRAIRKGVC